MMRKAIHENPEEKFGSELDRAVHIVVDYYEANGQWEHALDVMREAASRSPDEYDLELNQALRDAFEYYRTKGRCNRALDVMRDAARMNPPVFGPLLEEALVDLARRIRNIKQERIDSP